MVNFNEGAEQLNKFLVAVQLNHQTITQEGGVRHGLFH